MKKKDGKRQRLVLDTRAANASFRRPDHCALPTPAAMSSLRAEGGMGVHMAQVDIDNAFYRLPLPDLMEKRFILPAAGARLLVKEGVRIPEERRAAPRSPACSL